MPETAAGVVPADRLALFQTYAESLATDGVVRGLIGPREVPRLWERHMLNSAALGEIVPADVSLGDIGSGAGLPGLALAIARPDLRVTLVEPLVRRATYLEEVVTALGLGDQVEVVRARAEELHGARAFDAVTARAVAPLERLLRWCMPLVAPTGALVALKGTSVEAEIAEAAPVLARLRCAPPEVLTVGSAAGSASTHVVRVEWADPATVGLPLARGRRRSGGSQAGRARERRRQTRSAPSRRDR